MKPSSLSIKTSSAKRARSQDSRVKADSLGSPTKTESVPVEMRPQIPKFLTLGRQQISSRFHDLEWQQRFRIAHGLQHADSPWKVDRSSVVIQRNRYLNIQPWSNSRVILRVPAGQSDYVNASPIVLADSKNEQLQNKYIATQGPKDTSHFWHMVMQETQEPAVVIMLTQTHEGLREKCAQYFPTSMEAPVIQLPAADKISDDEEGEPHDPFYAREEPLTSGSLTLLEVDKTTMPRSEIRKFKLDIGDESRTVYHYLFVGWPDFAKPEGEDRQALLDLIQYTSSRVGNPSTNPRIVHCSAGVGRTGSFIALDYLLKELEAGAFDPASLKAHAAAKAIEAAAATKTTATNGHGNGTNTAPPGSTETSPKDDESSGTNEDLVYQCVNLLRAQRMMMVMNEIQYSFIYEVLRERYEAKYFHNAPAFTLIPKPAKPTNMPTRDKNTTPTPAPDTNAEGLTTHTSEVTGDDIGSGLLQTDTLMESGERSPKIARKNSHLSQISHFEGSKDERQRQLSTDDTTVEEDEEGQKGDLEVGDQH